MLEMDSDQEKDFGDRPSPFKDLLNKKTPQFNDDSQDRIPFCQVKQIMSKVKKAQLANQNVNDDSSASSSSSSPLPSNVTSSPNDNYNTFSNVTATPMQPPVPDRSSSFEIEKGEISGSILDLDFIYDDSDHFISELSEFYAYTEVSDFDLNKESFYEIVGADKKWSAMSVRERRSCVLVILDCLEVASEERRLAAIRALAYLCQGNFSEVESEEDVMTWTRKNCFLLYEMGIFLALFDTLKVRVDAYLPRQGDKTVAGPGGNYGNTYAAATVAGPNAQGTDKNGAPQRKPNSQQAATLGDCVELRTILSVLYTITEVLRTSDLDDTHEQTEMRAQFAEELGQPIVDGELPAVILFQLVLNVASDKTSPIPTKKTLLLLWKFILTSLGGLEHAQELKNKTRSALGLEPLPEDSIKVIRQMRASTPPLIASEMLDQQQNPGASLIGGGSNSGSPTPAGKKRANAVSNSVGKRSEARANASGDVSGPRDSMSLDEINEREGDGEGEELDDSLGVDDGGGAGDSPDDEEVLISLEPTPERAREPRALPWQPKIRTKDIQDFLDHSRIKYVGYKLKSDPEPDLTTLAGLPQPIKESISILRQHLYVPLSEVQLKQEDLLLKHPISLGREEEVEETPTELLYKAIHPNLPQYMIALLKILLAATPTSPQGKSDTVNLLSDLLPPQMPSGVVEAMKFTIDVSRHKEIIVKAVSALLLLLLKHFKLNHVCQFEHCAQHMVFANCIPLVLKFFNQSIGNYVQATHSIAPLQFPTCVVGEREEINEENVKPPEKGPTYYCWRNLFSCINLLRILNKLVKWKNSRIMMLVVFKSGPILKRALKVRQAMLQLYVLKLIKVQTKFLGRQWRKSNMKTMSVIYQKVRHRLHDDWAFGNEPDSRPWDFQLEEGLLRSRVEKFNTRRYESHSSNTANNGTTGSIESTYEPVDNNLHSLLNQDVQLPRVFTDNYEQWLEKEVFLRNINWDVLLEQ